jgi:hypothetical protein
MPISNTEKHAKVKVDHVKMHDHNYKSKVSAYDGKFNKRHNHHSHLKRRVVHPVVQLQDRTRSHMKGAL